MQLNSNPEQPKISVRRLEKIGRSVGSGPHSVRCVFESESRQTEQKQAIHVGAEDSTVYKHNF